MSMKVVNAGAHARELVRVPKPFSTKESPMRAHTDAWSQPGPASFDLRSDTATTATPDMLKAISKTGINDGWTGSGAVSFEKYMAGFVSREAALFMVSSTMGNQVALRTHLQCPPNGIICDVRSHIVHMEAGSMASLSGALAQTVMPSNGLYLTLEDIKRKIVLSDSSDSCTCPTRLIHLENPLGGVIAPLAEVRRITKFARENGIKLHMDGARLWEAIAVGEGTLPQWCAEVDSINMCLTKGIGASVGAILVGDGTFIAHAKWVRKSIGGAMRQPGWVAAAAWQAVNHVFGLDPTGRESVLLRKSHLQARELAQHWLQRGGRLVAPQQTNMVWLDLDAAGIDEEEWEILGREAGLILHSSRLITHYQVEREAIERLKSLMSQVLQSGRQARLLGSSVCQRNDSVSRLAAAMKETVFFATKSSVSNTLTNISLLEGKR